MNDDKNFVSTPEAEKILKLSRHTIYKKIMNGELKAKKMGNGWRISKESIEEALKI